MKTYFVAIALFILVSYAFARIGETEQQIAPDYDRSRGQSFCGAQSRSRERETETILTKPNAQCIQALQAQSKGWW